MTDIAIEAKYPGEYIINEISIDQCRKQVVIESGQTLGACTVLGKVATSTASYLVDLGNTGDGVIGTIIVGTGAKQGDYALTMIEPDIDAGDFIVEDPDGINVGSGSVGTVFTGGGLSFTLDDGGTDFDAGDSFVITVAEGSGEYTQLDLSGTDGRAKAVAILFSPVDASLATQKALITAGFTVVQESALTWPDGITVDEKTAAIKQLDIQNITIK